MDDIVRAKEASYYFKIRKTAGLLILFTCFGVSQALGQEKINITAGAGLPELFNTGVRFQIKDNTRQLGIYLGYAGKEAQAVTGDVFLNFAGHSLLSDRKPWYWRTGMTLYHSSNNIEEQVDWDLVFSTRLGREINLSRRLGFNLDGGIIISPFTGLLYDEYHIIPGLGFGFFFRI